MENCDSFKQNQTADRNQSLVGMRIMKAKIAEISCVVAAMLVICGLTTRLVAETQYNDRISLDNNGTITVHIPRSLKQEDALTEDIRSILMGMPDVKAVHVNVIPVY